MKEAEKVAYDALYLNDVCKVHRYLFTLLNRNKEYDTFSLIDSYMQHSEIRSRMDVGNWSALNKSGKQLYNSTPLKYAKGSNIQDDYDDAILEWVADIYVRMQWKYNIPSTFLSQKIPAKDIYKAYYPLHETSYDNACAKLYNKYIKLGDLNE